MLLLGTIVGDPVELLSGLVRFSPEFWK